MPALSEQELTETLYINKPSDPVGFLIENLRRRIDNKTAQQGRGGE